MFRGTSFIDAHDQQTEVASLTKAHGLNRNAQSGAGAIPHEIPNDGYWDRQRNSRDDHRINADQPSRRIGKRSA